MQILCVRYFPALEFKCRSALVETLHMTRCRASCDPDAVREIFHAGHPLDRPHPWPAGRDTGLRGPVRQCIGGKTMTIDLWLAAITAIGLLLYLVAVLARPERF